MDRNRMGRMLAEDTALALFFGLAAVGIVFYIAEQIYGLQLNHITYIIILIVATVTVLSLVGALIGVIAYLHRFKADVYEQEFQQCKSPKNEIEGGRI